MANSEVIAAVRAEAVPGGLLIEAHRLGPQDYRIRMRRGIGWMPEVYGTRDDVIAKLLPMRAFGAEHAQMCKAVGRPEPHGQ